jgi:putative flippase GtrA
MRTLTKFSLVGVVNTLVGYAVIFGLMYGVGLGPMASNVAGYAVGMALNFILNRTITFSSRAPLPSELFRFLVAFAVAFVLNLLVLHISIDWTGIDAGLGQLIAGVFYVVIFYLLSKYVVFAKPASSGA